jgi:prepilin-type processing-associated H-X9-DG protein
MANTLQDVNTYQKVDELMRVCRSAVRKAQAKSRELGVANVYFLDGHLYYELPSGEYTRNRPPSKQRYVRN